MMPATIAEMSPAQFESFISAIIERKLKELLGTDNAILFEETTLKPDVQKRLLKLQSTVRNGHRGVQVKLNKRFR